MSRPVAAGGVNASTAAEETQFESKEVRFRAYGDNVVTYRWLDAGELEEHGPENGFTFHEAVQLTRQGRTYQVRTGDAVWINDQSDPGTNIPYLVEALWQPYYSDDQDVRFSASEFWRNEHFKCSSYTKRFRYGTQERSTGYELHGSLTKEELMARMELDEVVLTDNVIDRDIKDIMGPCFLSYRATDGNAAVTAAVPPRVPKPWSYFCQYRACFYYSKRWLQWSRTGTDPPATVALLPISFEEKRSLTRSLTDDQRLEICYMRRVLREQAANANHQSEGPLAPAIAAVADDDDDLNGDLDGDISVSEQDPDNTIDDAAMALESAEGVNTAAAEETEVDNADANSTGSSAITYHWVDAGVLQADGRVLHQAVQLTSQGRTYQVRTGDAVLLFSDESDWFAQWPCRVEQLWQPAHSMPLDDGSMPVLFSARWFWHKGDLEQLGYAWHGDLTKEELMARMELDEVVLSNHVDENEIATIEGPCFMSYRATDGNAAAAPPRVPQPKSFFCQYRVDLQAGNASLKLLPISVEEKRSLTRSLTDDQRHAIREQRRALREQTMNANRQSGGPLAPVLAAEEDDGDLDVDMSVSEQDPDDINDDAVMALESADDEDEEGTGAGTDQDRPPLEINRPQVENDAANATIDSSSSGGSSDGDDNDESGSSDTPEDHQMMEGEGSALRSDIMVGGRHQAIVGPFVPGQKVRSRKPKLVWKPDQITDATLHDYLSRLAAFHTPYLSHHGLTMQEPYSPLSAERTEEFLRQLPDHTSLTGSSISTASSICRHRNSLLKECDADAALELLHDHKYNVDAALETAKINLEQLSGGWTRAEKEIFDQGFRHYDGSLRMIGKKIGPTKDFRDVVDYHFRFKIPDQFRQYQDKKREQAVRMIECIEKRRYYEPSLYPPGENAASAAATANETERTAKRRKHWSETSVAESTGALEDRRQSAKDLLLQVQNVKGKDVMAEVAAIIRQLHASYDPETKDALFSLLRGHPDLQKRFLDFLPKRF